MVSLSLKDLVEAVFMERLNRFVIRCRLGNGHVDAHLADPGRLRELLVPGRHVWLQPAANPGRKTGWSAVLVETENNGLVSLVSALPNALVKAALANKAIPELSSWSLIRAEYPVGRHRFDFLLQRGPERMLLEVKSVTLVENSVGLFPDAVTLRGRRHLDSLAELTQSGEYQGAVLFVAQRSDAAYITAASHIDPRFAAAFTAARRAGVQYYGLSCRVSVDRIALEKTLPVLDPDQFASTS